MTTQTPPRTDIDVPVTSGEFTVLPEDVYVAEFTDFTPSDELPPEAQTFGPAVRLHYTVVEGDYNGEKLDELASLKGGPRAKLRQRADALCGGQFSDATIRLVPLLGKRLKLVVKVQGDEQKGYFNKIESALPIPPPRAVGTASAASGSNGRGTAAAPAANGAATNGTPAVRPPARKF